ncbi:UBA/THIF-type NAD/FAD binding protein [Candidatus Magnetoovum chiemensis]|nr:UBA/THIF-type NAD/FAD binding protein [Candidatus Magnetoovum chiemensis]
MELSNEELMRYKRQMMMDGWGQETQEKLKSSKVFIAGAGGLGSPVSFYLSVAGIGNLTICDFDSPDYTNLNRQILHDPTRIGMNKALSAKLTLEKLNPDVNVTAITDKITNDNADDLIGDAALIMDCMDNFETRYALNDAAIRKNIPMVYGSIWGLEGRMSFIKSPETPCFRCMFPAAPPKEVFPVVGATPAVIGSLQVLEAIKYLTGIGKNLKNKVLVWDGNVVDFRTFKTYKDPDCISCSRK